MRWSSNKNSLFAQFPLVHLCYVSHVVGDVLRRINERARTAKARFDGAFARPSEITKPEQGIENIAGLSLYTLNGLSYFTYT